MRLVQRRALTPLAVAAIALIALAGCTPTGDGGTPSSSPDASGEPSTTPTPGATDDPTGTPIPASCDQLVSPDTLFVYNPNFGAIDDYTPAAGTPGASALTYQGVACRWQNATNGQNIDVSVAELDDDTLTALKNAAFADSEMVPTYGDEAYFTVDSDSIGVAQVFQGPYWIVAESPVFFEPGDATEIIQSVIDGLGA
jgi:hypothetical protein